MVLKFLVYLLVSRDTSSLDPLPCPPLFPLSLFPSFPGHWVGSYNQLSTGWYTSNSLTDGTIGRDGDGVFLVYYETGVFRRVTGGKYGPFLDDVFWGWGWRLVRKVKTSPGFGEWTRELRLVPYGLHGLLVSLSTKTKVFRVELFYKGLVSKKHKGEKWDILNERKDGGILRTTFHYCLPKGTDQILVC